MGKLTPAQTDFLDILGREDARRALSTYRPAVKLVELGLASRVPGRWTSRMSYFSITDAGRAALAEHRGKKG